jgi:ElaB/YqjD/DUF883 family membrane-anchored ribosome-binding protein
MKTKLKRTRHAVRNDLYDDLTKIKAALSDATNSVRGRAGNLISHQIADVRDKTTDIQDNLVDYVTDKPLKSIGIAILTGVFIGLFYRK